MQTVTIFGLGLLIAGLVVWGLVIIVGGYQVVKRRRPDPPMLPSQWGMDYRAVSFESRDGLHLQGWWIPAPETNRPNVAIVQIHGQNGSMDADLPTAQFLHGAGFHVLMFNLRAHGDSAGKTLSFGWHEKNDLLGALDYLRHHHQIEQVGILAFSMGTQVAFHAAPTAPQIGCMVLDGTTGLLRTTLTRWLMRKKLPPLLASQIAFLVLLGASWYSRAPLLRLDAFQWLKQIKGIPILFIHAENDEFVAGETIQTMLKIAPPGAELWTVPDCQHRQTFERHPEAYKARVVEWFKRHLV
jgi:pimeloyl-ACP methyl ester carboxylesterase